MPLSRPVSQLRLLRLILGLRWFLLAMLPVQVGLAQGPIRHLDTIPAIAACFLYTLLLTVLAKRVLSLHSRGRAFSAIDMVVVLALYATGPTTNWAFFLYSTTTIFVAGLRGRVGEGVMSAVIWNVLTLTVMLAWRLPASRVFGIAAIEDLFNLSMVGAVWAYAVGLVGRLNLAYDELNDSTKALARTNARLDERGQEILGLMDAGNAIMRELDLDVILATVVGALEGMGFGACSVWAIEEGCFRAIYPPGELAPDVAATSGSPLASAVQRREPVSVRPGQGSTIPGFDPDKLAIAVPVMTQEEALGVLAVESISGEEFDENEKEMLGLFADQVALALQHIHFYEQTQELAVAEERVRITREIHDTVVQKIYGANLIAEALCHEAVSPATAEKLHVLQETILASLKDLRFAVLNWDSLEWRTGLHGLVERYTTEFSALTGIAVSVVLRGDESRCRPMKAKDVLRVLQAALSNVWRHAHAGSVQVDLECGETGIGLSVRDDGRGFDVSDAMKRTTVGIADMKGRGQRNNGTVEITSAPGDGTHVRVWIPC